jgi:hypothetical protein
MRTKISTTLNLYTHVFEEADDQAAAALNLSLSGGKYVSGGIRWQFPGGRGRLILQAFEFKGKK